MSTCIPALVQRHAADAAWYYTQFDADRASFLVTDERLHHYQRLFVAHLDGLLAAADNGLAIAHSQLARWKGPGELFTCFHLALRAQAPKYLEKAWSFLQQFPTGPYIDAAAQAFAWLPAHPLLEHWLASDTVLAQQIALNALGLRRERAHATIIPWFGHQSPNMRAEICRYAGRLRIFECIPQLRQACTDLEPEVREQAAVALLLCNEPLLALPELYAAVHRHATAVKEGVAALRTESRAQHLARLLGHALPFPCTQTTLNALDLPPYLTMLMLAHHGDPTHVDRLLPWLQESTHNQRALWAIGFITGIDPEKEGLTSDAPFIERPNTPGNTQDAGLPEPAPGKVENWWKAPPVAGPALAGKTMSGLVAAKECLTHGTQAQRFAAALHVVRLNTNAPWVDTRAPLLLQRRLESASERQGNAMVKPKTNDDNTPLGAL